MYQTFVKLELKAGECGVEDISNWCDLVQKRFDPRGPDPNVDTKITFRA